MTVLKSSIRKLTCVFLAVFFSVIFGISAGAEENNWLPVPLSTEEASNHLYYKIEEGVLTFKDTGDSSLEDYGILPNYSNISRDNPTDYAITEWFQRKNGITVD